MKRAFVFIFATFATQYAAAQFPTYHLTEIVSGAAPAHVPTSFTNDNRALGYVDSTHTTAYSWSAGILSSIPLLAGDTDNTAYAGSSVGATVGTSGHVSGNIAISHAYEWKSSVLTQLNGLSGSTDDEVFAINNSDVAVGLSNSLPVTYAGGTAATLPGLSSSSVSFGSANSINNAGDITGMYEDLSFDFKQHAFLTSGGVTTTLAPLSGYDESVGNSINSSKVVVGNSINSSTGVSHPTMWIGGTAIDIGSLSGTPHTFEDAVAINASGVAVGRSRDAGGATRGYIYSQSLGMVALNSLLDSSGTGFSVNGCYGISDSGQIYCAGASPDGGGLFVLTPVPEPSTLLALGSLGMLAMVKRRRQTRN